MATSEQNTPEAQQQVNKAALDSNGLQECDNVKIVTSLERIGAALGYLAQCDYVLGNNGDSLNGDELFGRGYLLEMLGNGVSDFAKEHE